MEAGNMQKADLTADCTGHSEARAGEEVPTGDTKHTEAGEADKVQNIASQTGIGSGQVKQTACIDSVAPTNENSAPAENQNLLMLGTGKNKLAHVHYVFDPTELSSIAEETRAFTRDGFAKGSIHRHPGCSTDACFLPEKPFECSDHRGHHC